MTDKPTPKTSRGRLRALADWLKGTVVATPDPAASSASAAGPPARLGHYAITGKLGQGGMGVVYSARDERLERTVAIKTMSGVGSDDTARRRFWREARAAASVNHPNVCQLYEIGEQDGELFIAMELLQGEALSERLRRGALSVSETLPIGLEILAALQALHSRGIVHRDLKPSNVFLTSHGVKLLDFGLARTEELDAARSLGSAGELTRTGMMLGTPRYMSPEQVIGEVVGPRSDLFAAGAILFEMLAGRPAFTGRNVVEILHATLSEQPPALSGSPAIAAADRMIRRALAKRPEERFDSAEAMAAELRAVGSVAGEDTPALARALTRIVVLPFRPLRPDPETDFLAFSLPDAISTSLSRVGSLIVRSSATGARFGGEAPDLKAVAAEADVDRVVMGTLLRAGDQLRVAAQLVEAPAGTLLTAHTVQSSLGDLFRLQDDIARRVVEALALPLGAGEASPTPDAPRNPRAYSLYLQANELARSYDQLKAARELYQRSLELDPGFAPAWAQLGRCHRVIGKFIEGSEDSLERAEQAFRRALELQPGLSVAHKLYAQLEVETGQVRQALVRLLTEADRHGNDPELFAGLVHVCRYCGLFEESLAAHEEARRLDPNVPTSFAQTLLLSGDPRLLEASPTTHVGSADDSIRALALGLAGRRDEARQALLDLRQASQIRAFHVWADSLVAWLERRPVDIVVNAETLGPLSIMEDPEALFEQGWLLCDVGDYQHGLDFLGRAVAKGYAAADTLAKSPQFDRLRGESSFQQILAAAEAGRREALVAFREAGGERLLGRRLKEAG